MHFYQSNFHRDLDKNTAFRDETFAGENGKSGLRHLQKDANGDIFAP
jgi:hypothetical protein